MKEIGATLKNAREDMGVSFLSDTFEDVVQAMVDSGEETDPLLFMSIDRDKLASYVNSAFDEKRVAPVLPEIVWNEHEKCYTAVAGEPETWYSREKLTEMVYEAVTSLPAVLEIDEAELYQEHLDVQKEALAADLADGSTYLLDSLIQSGAIEKTAAMPLTQRHHGDVIVALHSQKLRL